MSISFTTMINMPIKSPRIPKSALYYTINSTHALYTLAMQKYYSLVQQLKIGERS